MNKYDLGFATIRNYTYTIGQTYLNQTGENVKSKQQKCSLE